MKNRARMGASTSQMTGFGSLATSSISVVQRKSLSEGQLDAGTLTG